MVGTFYGRSLTVFCDAAGGKGFDFIVRAAGRVREHAPHVPAVLKARAVLQGGGAGCVRMVDG